MPLPVEDRERISSYCRRDIPSTLQWYVDQFSFVTDSELQNRLGRAFYSARYISKLMEALHLEGQEVHPFVKFQVIQYASIYEAVIAHLLWGRYKNHPEVKSIQLHKEYKKVDALGDATEMKFGEEKLYTCVYRDVTMSRKSIPFANKVDCAVRIGFVEATYAEEIKNLYQLRNLDTSKPKLRSRSKWKSNTQRMVTGGSNHFWKRSLLPSPTKKDSQIKRKAAESR